MLIDAHRTLKKGYGELTTQTHIKLVGKIIVGTQFASNPDGEDCFLFASASTTEAILLCKVITIQS